MLEIQSTHSNRPNCLHGYFRAQCKEFTSYHGYLFKVVVSLHMWFLICHMVIIQQADGKG